MTELSIWKNKEISQLRKDVQRSFRRLCDCFGVPFSMIEAFETFEFEMQKTHDGIVFTAHIPGLKIEALNISVTETRLLLNGEIRETVVDSAEGQHCVSHRSGAFSRTFALPYRVDTEAVKAIYQDGRLKINLPRAKEKTRDRIGIEIR